MNFGGVKTPNEALEAIALGLLALIILAILWDIWS